MTNEIPPMPEAMIYGLRAPEDYAIGYALARWDIPKPDGYRFGAEIRGEDEETPTTVRYSAFNEGWSEGYRNRRGLWRNECGMYVKREETAWDRAETDACERGTVGCSVRHTGDSDCETW
jgi:hypothetical protein